MSGTSTELHAIYLDGETKTGKGAAGAAIARALNGDGHRVYYDVAGDFYRRFAALVRVQLGLGEEEPLPTENLLEVAAKKVDETRAAYAPDPALGDLQRRSISKSVSVLGELPLAQAAGKRWWALMLRNAAAAGAEVLVVDGRNPRRRVAEQLEATGVQLSVTLDLFMTCEPQEAARRILLAEGVAEPTGEQLAAEAQKVMDRRTRDLTRADTPFLLPEASVAFVPGKVSSSTALARAWQPAEGVELPCTVVVDNTAIDKSFMLETVVDLAREALRFKVV